MNFSIHSIKVKIYLSFIIVLLTSAIVIAISVYDSKQNINSSTFVENTLLVSYAEASNAEKSFSRVNNMMLILLSEKDDAKALALYQEFESVTQAAKKNIFDLNENNLVNTEFKNLVLNTKQATIDYFNFLDKQIIPYIENNQRSIALEFYIKDGVNLFYGVVSNIKSAIAILFENVAMFTKKAADPTGIYIAITLGILSTIFGLFCANYLSKLITRPLNALNNVVTKIANGDLTHVFKFKNGKDEFAYNSRFVEKMQDSLNKALRLTVDECNRIHTTLSDIQKLSDNIVIKTDATEGQALTVASASEQMVSTTQDISRNCESATLSS